MPRPSRRPTRSRQSNGATSFTTPAAFIGDIDNAVTWEAIVQQICRSFDLPNLSTRHGLKKVHQDFNSIHGRLDQAYLTNSSNVKITGGVVAIFAKMCADSILRDKIMENGFLERLLPLLEFDFSRHMALRALTTVTHHGGDSCRAEIASYSPTLVRLMEQHPNDAKVIELSIVTLAHSIAAVIGKDELPSKKALREIDLPSVLKVVVDNLRKPSTTRYAITHAASLLSVSPYHCSDVCKDFPSMGSFLVAGLRSADCITRCTCLGGIIRLNAKGAEQEKWLLEPKQILGVVDRFPRYLNDILTAYGPMQTELYQTLATTFDNQSAFLECAEDRDIYSLGLKLSEFISRTESSIIQGAFEKENPRSGEMEIADLGLPFVMWVDALPHCAKAIRDKAKPQEQHLADILEVKYLVTQWQIPRAVTLAQTALERWPDVAYFYYAATFSTDIQEGLRAAKKGLKCANITPFLRFQMLQRSVMHAGDLGLIILQDAPSHDKQRWEEGVTFLTSALEDAKTYLDKAPPDSRHIKNMAYWYILLTFVLRGPEMSMDMKELRTTFKKLEIAEEIGTLIGCPPAKTMLRLTQQNVTKLYPEAVKEWGEVIERFDVEFMKEGNVSEGTLSTSNVEDDLAEWLDDGPGHGDDDDDQPYCAHPKVNTNCVELYRCSWCGAPSAALRKCGGCSKARYCDSGCQKSHWKDHKKSCQRQRTAS